MFDRTQIVLPHQCITVWMFSDFHRLTGLNIWHRGLVGGGRLLGQVLIVIISACVSSLYSQLSGHLWWEKQQLQGHTFVDESPCLTYLFCHVGLKLSEMESQINISWLKLLMSGNLPQVCHNNQNVVLLLGTTIKGIGFLYEFWEDTSIQTIIWDKTGVRYEGKNGIKGIRTFREDVISS